MFSRKIAPKKFFSLEKLSGIIFFFSRNCSEKIIPREKLLKEKEKFLLKNFQKWLRKIPPPFEELPRKQFFAIHQHDVLNFFIQKFFEKSQNYAKILTATVKLRHTNRYSPQKSIRSTIDNIESSDH